MIISSWLSRCSTKSCRD
uniref:Uncharacterized protein n=1 Tax=Arundo donax TaxID=35708 RepID=A0A0A8YHS5_ARUDO